MNTNNLFTVTNSIHNTDQVTNLKKNTETIHNYEYSTIQLKTNNKMKLTLRTFLSYYEEYSNIKINHEYLNYLKSKSKTSKVENSSNDKMYAYYDQKSHELIFSEKENSESKNSNQLTLVATGVYDRSRFQTGWDKLNIKTYSGANPLIQCWVAGFLEGILSSEEIYYYFRNIHVFFYKQEGYINDIKNFYGKIDEQLRKLISMDAFQKLKAKSENEYKRWSYITCFHSQLDGLHAGYNTIADSDKQLDLLDFYFINSEGNFGDLKTFMKINKMKIHAGEQFYTNENLKRVYETDNIEKIWRNIIRSGHCSAIVKLVNLPDGTLDMIAGHNTWSEYCEMMRTLKNVEFSFEGDVNKQVVGMKPRTINYSSYPGVLFSGDDFYQIDSKIVILQTTLSAINKFIYKNILNVEQYIPEFIRIMVTNHLSNSGKEWVDNYNSYKNHMYITQWIVLDYNVLSQINSDKESINDNNESSRLSKKYANSGLVYLVEEVPGSIMSVDLSETVLAQSYFGSFNLAYFHEHQKILGLKNFQNIDFTSKHYNPRYYILKSLHSTIRNLIDFSHLIRYNGFNNKNKYCEKDPSFSDPSSGISSRSDLLNDGLFNGGIDFKIVNKDLVDKMTVLAYGGPTYDNNPNLSPFNFSKMNGLYYDSYHIGIPDKWNFEPFYFSENEFQQKTATHIK